MVLLPAQILAQRQAGEDWVRAVSDYTIGDLTVRTRVTAKSWNGIRPRVRVFLDELSTTIPYSIGAQTGQPAQLGYQRSSFRTACLKIYPMEACTRLWMAWKPRLKLRKNWQTIRIYS